MFFPSLRRFVFNAIKRCATCEEKKESCTDSLAYDILSRRTHFSDFQEIQVARKVGLVSTFTSNFYKLHHQNYV